MFGLDVAANAAVSADDGFAHRALMVRLGFWYGWGYCPCTEWHWQVRSRLGFVDPPSYIQLLIQDVTGIGLGARAADVSALVSLATATLLGVTLSVRDRRRATDQ